MILAQKPPIRSKIILVYALPSKEGEYTMAKPIAKMIQLRGVYVGSGNIRGTLPN